MQSDQFTVAASPDLGLAEVERRSKTERRQAWRVVSVLVPMCFFITGFMLALAIFQSQIRHQASVFEEATIKLQASIDALKKQESTDRNLVLETSRNFVTDLGLVPPKLLRDRKKSVVELYSYTKRPKSVSYGTAIYLGEGYFLTVKHAVVTLAKNVPPVDYMHVVTDHKGVRAILVDMGNAARFDEISSGDWAILKAEGDLHLTPVKVTFDYPEFAEPLFRLGNDYSNGIVVATGNVGPTNKEGIASSLTDAHFGSSGGAVMNKNGELVGISIGQLGDDFHYAYILPIRPEMFRKVPHIGIR